MNEQLLNSRSAPQPRSATLPAALLLLGLAQALLVLLAIARIVDPGSGTAEAVGTLVGLGMATAAFTWTRTMPSRNPTASTRFGALGVVAGLVLAAVWLSLLGGPFYTDDVVRVGAVVASDLLFSVWLIAATRLAPRDQPRAGIDLIAFLLSLRAIGEVVLFLPYALPSNDGGQMVLVIVVAGLVLFGWIVLALWEIALGAWLLRARTV